jgi:hypothetical protein
MIGNNLFWANHIRANFLPGIDYYAKCLEKKIIPAFDSIEKEADEIEKEAFENPSGYFNPENYDPADAAEDAFEKGLEYYEWMNDMLQGILNLFAAGLYHLFEQQLLLIHRKELLTINEKDNIGLLKLKEAKSRLSKNGIIVENFNSWSKIDELRIVANTVKHADGQSAQELKSKRPDLFSRTTNPPFITPHSIPPGPVRTPLAGDSLYITQDELNKFIDAVKEFWNEMCSALEKQANSF